MTACCGHARCQDPPRSSLPLPPAEPVQTVQTVQTEQADHLALLRWRSTLPNNGIVWVEGGWVVSEPSVPTEDGVATLARFAGRCWRANLRLQADMLAADKKLDTAEERLRRHASLFELNVNVSIALEAVCAARELL
jgi:hypothetical protein